VLRSGGGGGFGDPFEREIVRVQEDVRQGYVTVCAARRDYGVAIDPVSFEVDEAETKRLRSRHHPA
jgi:N-methylhydantoinase B